MSVAERVVVGIERGAQAGLHALHESDTCAAQVRELRRLAEAYATPEHKEAVAAYLERREPTFR